MTLMSDKTPVDIGFPIFEKPNATIGLAVRLP